MRQEIEAALEAGKPVYPLLVGGASIPPTQALPTGIARLASFLATILNRDTWMRDVRSLAKTLLRDQVVPPEPDGAAVRPIPNPGKAKLPALTEHDVAYRHLRRAVELDDDLSYTEPWAWMHPPRHALAALLLDQGHVEEAEQVYRDDLGLSSRVQRCAQHPDNVWALHGLVECLKRRGESNELASYQVKLAAALAKTDMAVSSSCLCRTSAIFRGHE